MISTCRIRQEFRQVFVARYFQDGQVAAVNDPPAQGPCPVHESPEFRIEFRRSAGHIQDLHGTGLQEMQHQVHMFRAHEFGAMRAGVDMAVHALLVAFVAQVHLQRAQTPPPHRRKGVLLQQG